MFFQQLLFTRPTNGRGDKILSRVYKSSATRDKTRDIEIRVKAITRFPQ